MHEKCRKLYSATCWNNHQQWYGDKNNGLQDLLGINGCSNLGTSFRFLMVERDWMSFIFLFPSYSQTPLTLWVPMVTNINFLLTMSIHCQEKRLWELIKWSPKWKCIDLLWNSLNSFFKEMYGGQFGEFVMGILELKGLNRTLRGP